MTGTAAARSLDLGARRAAGAGEDLQGTCARPTCHALFTRPTGPGRPALFCGDDCRRAAQRERRALRTRLAHYERQVQHLRSLVAAYEHGADDDETVEHGQEFMTPEEVRRAEDAVAEARGMARFMREVEDPVSIAFVELLDAVGPVVDHGRRQQLPLR